jgi:large subunit ribosomal protein L30
MPDVTITQVRSAIHSDERQLDTLRSLKLGSIGKTASFTDSPNLRGMIRVVDHLVEVSGDPDGADAKAEQPAGRGS